MQLRDRTAIITGASRGLGRALARHFCAAGANVLLLARDGEALAEVQQELAGRATAKVEAADPSRAGTACSALALQQRDSEGEAPERVAALAEFLASAASDGITGRLFSAVWDDWQGLVERKAQLAHSDVFTLRRIVPADRKGGWQCV